MESSSTHISMSLFTMSNSGSISILLICYSPNRGGDILDAVNRILAGQECRLYFLPFTKMRINRALYEM